MNRKLTIGVGVSFIVMSVAILVMALWEGYTTLSGNIKILEIPGFHQLELKTAGLYVGVYQHQGQGPVPTDALSQLDVRVLSMATYEQVPVLLNNSAQTFNSMGATGMHLFTFMINQAGSYSMSAVYRGDFEGPKTSILLFSQGAQGVKQTMIVGSIFFLLLLGLGIYVLVKVKKWYPARPR